MLELQVLADSSHLFDLSVALRPGLESGTHGLTVNVTY